MFPQHRMMRNNKKAEQFVRCCPAAVGARRGAGWADGALRLPCGGTRRVGRRNGLPCRGDISILQDERSSFLAARLSKASCASSVGGRNDKTGRDKSGRYDDDSI